MIIFFQNQIGLWDESGVNLKLVCQTNINDLGESSFKKNTTSAIQNWKFRFLNYFQ